MSKQLQKSFLHATYVSSSGKLIKHQTVIPGVHFCVNSSWKKSLRGHELLWQSHWCSFGGCVEKFEQGKAKQGHLENSMCGSVGDGRLMLHISLGIVI